MPKTLLSSAFVAADYKAARLAAQSVAVAAALLPLTLGTIAHAQIVTFDTSGLTQPQSIAATFNATQQAAGVNGTPQLSRTGLTATGGAAGSFFTNAGGNNTNTLNLADDYVGFTVAPSATSVLFATSIQFTSQGSATAPNSYIIGYSTDGFATATTSSTFTASATTAVLRTFNITDLITSDSLQVRLYNFGATSVNNGAASATGSYRVITPSVSGSTVTAATGNITLANATEVRNSSALTLGGVISGGTNTLNKTGAGVLTLTGDNTFTGDTTISAGTLQIGNGGTTGSLVSNTIANNAALVFNRSNDIVQANDITGTGTVTQQGAAILTLSGTNTYSGATTVSSGTLNVTGTASNSAVTVNSGGTLAGEGTVGAITLNSGAFLNPGDARVNTTATLTSSALTLNGGNIVGFALGGDLLNVTGVFDITAATSFAFTGGTAGTTYDLVTAGSLGSGFTGGNVSGLSASGATGTFQFTGNTLRFVISNGGAVPEPGSIALLLTSGVPVGGFLLRRRFVRRAA